LHADWVSEVLDGASDVEEDGVRGCSFKVQSVSGSVGKGVVGVSSFGQRVRINVELGGSVLVWVGMFVTVEDHGNVEFKFDAEG